MLPSDHAKRRSRSEQRIQRALKGREGYKVQREAWDAAMPGWRRLLKLVNGRGVARLTPKQQDELAAFSACLCADNRRLAKAWYQLLMQDLYRRVDRDAKRRGHGPQNWGWYPR